MEILHQEQSNESVPFLSHSTDIPERTKYRTLFCPFSPFWSQEDDPYYIHFRYGFCPVYPTLLGISLNVICGLYWIFKLGPLFWEKKPWVIYVFALLYGLDLWSFFISLWANPGVLPYDYFSNPRKKYTLNEICAGSASTEEQYKYAKSQKRLGRMIFSVRTGTYILRADHFCPWIGNYVGAYNRHQFILATLYISLACSFAFGTSIYAYNNYHVFYWPRLLPYLFITGAFSFLCGFQFFTQLYSITKNVTYIEMIKQSKPIYDRGCFNNWEEVCGKREYLLCWLLPIQLPLPIDPFTYDLAPENPLANEKENTSQKPEENTVDMDVLDGV